MNTNQAALAAKAHPRVKATANDFYILRRNGHWSILAGSSYFGQYASAERAVPLALRVARDAACVGMGTRVILMGEDGSVRELWNAKSSKLTG